MIIRADDFDHEYMKITGLRRMQKKQRGNPGTRAKRRYRDEVTAFDIETSTIPLSKTPSISKPSSRLSSSSKSSFLTIPSI